MTARRTGDGFAARPRDAETWIKAAERTVKANSASEAFSARLTFDVTPALRGRIKVAAFQRGITVADMLRELLEKEYSAGTGDAS